MTWLEWLLLGVTALLLALLGMVWHEWGRALEGWERSNKGWRESIDSMSAGWARSIEVLAPKK